MNIRSIAALFLVTPLSGVASAEMLLERKLPTSIAAEIAQYAVQICAADGYSVSASVVDKSGAFLALTRSDNAAPHTVESSRRKAFTALSMGQTTTQVVAYIQKNPASAQLAAIDGFLMLGGGVPIAVGGELIAAVGVGGAPGGDLDEACAVKAIERVQARLK